MCEETSAVTVCGGPADRRRRRRSRPDTDAIRPDSTASRRVCFLGDSLVLGVGDPTERGWVGRMPGLAAGAGIDLTSYNLGVRGQTMPMIAERFSEVLVRLPYPVRGRLVVSGGINDADLEGGRVRSAASESVAALDELLRMSASAGIDTLVVSPTPVADVGHRQRLEGLSQAFSVLAEARSVPYADVMSLLSASSEWGREMADGDGYHPSAPGYRHLAEAVWYAGMRRWLTRDCASGVVSLRRVGEEWADE
ncbi:GDSL-type esterase/lipase family protein [Streptomyces sp. SCSIO 30461]|uniref:GDSL-type esterase/lipase family protein n=1 Tax=Streptomyces sp. SCSIO 30461 TaxID=3118085 RepID=UPI0030D2199E